MTARPVVRDERTVATENASYRWAYLVLSYGLLASTAWRAFGRNEPAWDLIGLVVLGGVVATFHQGSHRVLTRRWGLLTAAAVTIALVLGALIVLLRR